MSTLFDMLYREEDVKSWILNTVTDKETLPYLYMYAGGEDPMEKSFCESMEKTYAFLETCYPSELLHKVVKPNQRHHESAWA